MTCFFSLFTSAVWLACLPFLDSSRRSSMKWTDFLPKAPKNSPKGRLIIGPYSPTLESPKAYVKPEPKRKPAPKTEAIVKWINENTGRAVTGNQASLELQIPDTTVSRVLDWIEWAGFITSEIRKEKQVRSRYYSLHTVDISRLPQRPRTLSRGLDGSVVAVD